MSVNPPRSKGPPLNALRAFEAAGRLESFAGAAEELSVTPAAISQHIKALEQWTDASLFERDAQGVRLSDAGRALLPHFSEAFDRLGAAVRLLREIRPRREIHIATMPSLAQLWLSPRLAAIRESLPDVMVSVTALERPPNLDRELFDLSLFLARPSGRATETVLGPDVIFPVCAPAMAEGINQPEDLNEVPRILDRTWVDDWRIWSEQCGNSIVNSSGSQYSLYSLALEEAKAGAGVLMGHAHLVDGALQSGELVRPYAVECQTGNALVVERPIGKPEDPVLDAIVDLLRDGN